MKNIFSKISSFAKNISSFAKEKIDSVTGSTKAKVGAILTASFLGVSSQVEASQNWIQVDTPGMGPREFSEKYFGTEDWKLLKDKEGNFVVNPNTDFKLGRLYTIGRRENIVKNESKKIAPVLTKNEKKVEVVEKKENLFISKETYNLSYQDLVSSFDYNAFVKSIIGIESSGNPRALNKKTGASGLLQFTKPALVSLGYHKNGEVTKGMLEQLMSDSKLQLKLAHKYHTKSLKIISENPEMLNKGLKQGKTQDIVIVELLAEAHFAGYGSMGKGWKGGDGLTTIPEYKGKTVKNYLKLVAANDPSISEKTPITVSQPAQTEKLTLKPVVVNPTILAQTKNENANTPVLLAQADIFTDTATILDFPVGGFKPDQVLDSVSISTTEILDLSEKRDKKAEIASMFKKVKAERTESTPEQREIAYSLINKIKDPKIRAEVQRKIGDEDPILFFKRQIEEKKNTVLETILEHIIVTSNDNRYRKAA